MKSKQENLPNLIVIGAAKCGTTSLHYYLGLHPEISMSHEKELNFFIRERNWGKGIKWYKSNFKKSSKVIGESSPIYTDYPVSDGVPKRMYAVIPEAKLIYILRDPVKRIISEYLNYYALRRENRDFSEIIKSENNQYIFRSQYYMQLMEFTKYFPKSNILIVTQENLLNQRQLVLKKIFKFLNVDDSFSSLKLNINWHQTKHKRRKTPLALRLEKTAFLKNIKKLPFALKGPVEKIVYFPFTSKMKTPVLDERQRKKIIEILKDDINSLRDFTNLDFNEWSV